LKRKTSGLTRCIDADLLARFIGARHLSGSLKRRSVNFRFRERLLSIEVVGELAPRSTSSGVRGGIAIGGSQFESFEGRHFHYPLANMVKASRWHRRLGGRSEFHRIIV